MIERLILFFMSNKEFSSFLANALATFYIIYQIYSIYNLADLSITHKNKCSDVNNKIKKIKKFIKLTKDIHKLDFFIKPNHIYNYNCGSINKIDKIFNKFSSLGYHLLLRSQCNDYKNDFNKMTNYIGIIDCYISISNLLKYNGFVLPNYDFNKNKPYIYGKQLWYPFYSFNQTKNDVTIGTDVNNYIITGPNTSGKTTYIRKTMITILLAQTICVTTCDFIKFTPFTFLFSYIDIPNISRINKSLFEAEMERCNSFCNILEKLDHRTFIFTIMDELFTGTNPYEGISGSYGVCNYLSTFPNSLLIITTHFNELTHLENDYPKKFKNKKFIVIKKENITNSQNLNDIYFRPFKIFNGVSNQNIAIDLLKYKGYNNNIIQIATNKLNQMIKNKITY